MNDITKLPKWAQKYIEKIERERETAIRYLNEHLDNQTPSPFFSDDLVSTGEQQGPSFKTRYFQAYRMSVLNGSIHLEIKPKDDGIELQWSEKDRSIEDIAMIPMSFCRVVLKSKDKMR